MSDIERGITRVNAGDLVRLANILSKSVLFFLPGVEQSDLDDREQTLVGIFRQFDEQWQASVLEATRSQLTLYQQTKAIEALPNEDREEAAYELVVRLLQLQGIDVARDEQGRPLLQSGELSAILQVHSEEDRLVIEELVRRVEHHKVIKASWRKSRR